MDPFAAQWPQLPIQLSRSSIQIQGLHSRTSRCRGSELTVQGCKAAGFGLLVVLRLERPHWGFRISVGIQGCHQIDSVLIDLDRRSDSSYQSTIFV